MTADTSPDVAHAPGSIVVDRVDRGACSTGVEIDGTALTGARTFSSER